MMDSNGRSRYGMQSARRRGMAKQAISVLATASAIGGCFLLSGCGHRTSIVQASQAKYPTAVAVYLSGCITCHGDNLQGGIGPNLQHVGSSMTVAQIVHRISAGGGAMPAYALPGDAILTTKQIRAVALWLSAQK